MLGLRAWPTPFMRPLYPFMIGGLITLYGVSKIQAIGVSTPEALKDPKNPYAASLAKRQGEHH
ncbi:hypothetical protein FRC14_000573 [Serendipita sp. 396]|nr:hypothetical protein FRC14_000573 [Serendipita sp. 396]KAG8826039.1 hypothetical protein FRC19_009822 [Serendipita sp. 401]KAG8829561.1 hypothetical protein FRC18_009235 [Serendipita sp. 400]KAG8846923.1 hypothetical protein FRB91_000344 [Serendipita sp. 411]